MTEILDQVEIREINEMDQMFEAFEVVKLMYKKMDYETYKNIIAEMIQRNDYKMVGAFLNGKLIGVCGYWVFVMLYCNRYIQISNLVVDDKYRGGGIGKKILQKCEEIGKRNNCQKIVLDSYTQNKKSHSLYFKQDYYIRGFHFMKDLNA